MLNKLQTFIKLNSDNNNWMLSLCHNSKNFSTQKEIAKESQICNADINSDFICPTLI